MPNSGNSGILGLGRWIQSRVKFKSPPLPLPPSPPPVEDLQKGGKKDAYMGRGNRAEVLVPPFELEL